MSRGFRRWFPVLLLMTSPQPGQGQAPSSLPATPRTWFVQAGATGTGLDADSPFGSARRVEAASAPGDFIILLPGPAGLDGGLRLKPRQVLRGARDASLRPVITNTSGDVNDGVGVVLAEGVRLEGIEIRDTHASGILGEDVDDVTIADVSIQNANAGRLVLDPSHLQIIREAEPTPKLLSVRIRCLQVPTPAVRSDPTLELPSLRRQMRVPRDRSTCRERSVPPGQRSPARRLAPPDPSATIREEHCTVRSR